MLSRPWSIIRIKDTVESVLVERLTDWQSVAEKVATQSVISAGVESAATSHQDTFTPPKLTPPPPPRTGSPHFTLKHPLMLPLLPLTLIFFSFSPSWNPITPAHAAQGNESCSIGDQRLQQGTYQFSSDCDAMWFCNSSSICDWKKCKRDDFPFGYWDNVTVPDKCSPGFFCPDEQDECQALLAVGSPCQLNRDGASCFLRSLDCGGRILMLWSSSLGGDI